MSVPLSSGYPQVALQLDYDELMSASFKLGDFGSGRPFINCHKWLATETWNCLAERLSGKRTQLIQPEALRAPEVIIGADWDSKADVWNLGCLVSRRGPLHEPVSVSLTFLEIRSTNSCVASCCFRQDGTQT